MEPPQGPLGAYKGKGEGWGGLQPNIQMERPHPESGVSGLAGCGQWVMGGDAVQRRNRQGRYKGGSAESDRPSPIPGDNG